MKSKYEEVNQIDEQWVKDNIDLESKRKNVQRRIDTTELVDLFNSSFDYISFDDFMGLLKKEEQRINTRYSGLEGTMKSFIEKDHEFNGVVISLVHILFTPESDEALIKRLVKSEKSKIRKRIKREIQVMKQEEKDLKEYKRLKAKYESKGD